jgi:tetratricopeptide (TPR) repeat protein
VGEFPAAQTIKSNLIAKQVSEKLHLRPSGEEQKRLGKRYTENTDAYQLYLKGRYYWNRRSPDSLKRANEYFQLAIDKDPSYALAYAGLAQSYVVFAVYEVQPPRESCPKAKAAAMKALKIDDNLGEAHAALAFAKEGGEWDWEGSGAEYKRALEINPDDATTRMWHGFYLACLGHLDEGAAEARRALDADPLSLRAAATYGVLLAFAGHPDQAILELRKSIDMDPSFAEAHFSLGAVYAGKGMFAEAIAEFQRAVSLPGDAPRIVGALGRVYAISGQRKLAEECLVRLKELSKQRYVAPIDIAVVYAGLKDVDQTFKYLELAYEDHSFTMLALKINGTFGFLRNDSRYHDLFRRMHLEP